jgi:hypothetical protein
MMVARENAKFPHDGISEIFPNCLSQKLDRNHVAR